MPTTEGEWTEVEYHEFPAVLIDWKDGKTKDVTGTILWRETVPTTGLNGEPREGTMYALASADGETFGFWGTANLDPQLAKVPDGTEVKIAYKGKESLGDGRSMHRFQVLTRTAP